MTRMIKKPDGEMIEDRRSPPSIRGNVIAVLITVLATSVAFSANKWINPIESKVEALELEYRSHAKEDQMSALAVSNRITKVEEGFVGMNARLERMDNKIDKLLERSYRTFETKRPYTAES